MQLVFLLKCVMLVFAVLRPWPTVVADSTLTWITFKRTTTAFRNPEIDGSKDPNSSIILTTSTDVQNKTTENQIKLETMAISTNKIESIANENGVATLSLKTDFSEDSGIFIGVSGLTTVDRHPQNRTTKVTTKKSWLQSENEQYETSSSSTVQNTANHDHETHITLTGRLVEVKENNSNPYGSGIQIDPDGGVNGFATETDGNGSTQVGSETGYKTITGDTNIDSSDLVTEPIRTTITASGQDSGKIYISSTNAKHTNITKAKDIKAGANGEETDPAVKETETTYPVSDKGEMESATDVPQTIFITEAAKTNHSANALVTNPGTKASNTYPGKDEVETEATKLETEAGITSPDTNTEETDHNLDEQNTDFGSETGKINPSTNAGKNNTRADAGETVSYPSEINTGTAATEINPVTDAEYTNSTTDEDKTGNTTFDTEANKTNPGTDVEENNPVTDLVDFNSSTEIRKTESGTGSGNRDGTWTTPHTGKNDSVSNAKETKPSIDAEDSTSATVKRNTEETRLDTETRTPNPVTDTVEPKSSKNVGITDPGTESEASNPAKGSGENKPGANIAYQSVTTIKSTSRKKIDLSAENSLPPVTSKPSTTMTMPDILQKSPFGIYWWIPFAVGFFLVVLFWLTVCTYNMVKPMTTGDLPK